MVSLGMTELDTCGWPVKQTQMAQLQHTDPQLDYQLPATCSHHYVVTQGIPGG